VIVKRIKNPKKSGTKATRITRLLNYILRPENEENKTVKCGYSGFRGFFTSDLKSQASEMLALSLEAVRSKDPIVHYVISWQKDEIPNSRQIEEAVGIFLDTVGLKKHQTIFAVHSDTDNLHLHLVVNRVHPVTRKPVEINNGLDIEVAHQAIAWIEFIQGWKSEKQCRYFVDEGGNLYRSGAATRKADLPSQRQRDIEIWTGKKSAQRIAKEITEKIFTEAESWQDIHYKLSVVGMKYEKSAGGAVLYVGMVGVKASQCGPQAKLSTLQTRFGKFEVSSQTHRLQPRFPEPAEPTFAGLDKYVDERDAINSERAARRKMIRLIHEHQLAGLMDQQRLQRERVFSENDWTNLRNEKKAMNIVLTESHALERKHLRSVQKIELKGVEQSAPPLPTTQQWRRVAIVDVEPPFFPIQQPQMMDERFDSEQIAEGDFQDVGEDDVEDESPNRDSWPRER
jgi:Relaxase/Mobilisation nuclease domain